METVDFTKGTGTVISTFSTETIEEYPQKYIVEIADDNSISIIGRVDVNRVLYKFVGFDNIKFAGVNVSSRADLESKIDEYFYKSTSGSGGGGGAAAGSTDDRHLLMLQGMGSNLICQGPTYLSSTTAAVSWKTLCIVPFWLHVDATLHGFQLCQGSSGGAVLTVTTTENKLGIYKYNPVTGALTLVAATANDKTIWERAQGVHFQVPLAAQYNATAGFYIAGFLSTWDTIVNTTSLMIGTQTLNATGGNAPAFFMLPSGGKFYGLKSGVNTLPSSINMSDFLPHTQGFWFGIY